jgi:hypothetical protein
MRIVVFADSAVHHCTLHLRDEGNSALKGDGAVCFPGPRICSLYCPLTAGGRLAHNQPSQQVSADALVPFVQLCIDVVVCIQVAVDLRAIEATHLRLSAELVDEKEVKHDTLNAMNTGRENGDGTWVSYEIR